MKNILIIAAPFGLGPAVKAHILASAFIDCFNVSIFTAGHAAAFLRKHVQTEVCVLDGQFRASFPERGALEAYDGFVCIGQVPALQHIRSLGLGGKCVFVDSTAQWRQQVHEHVNTPTFEADSAKKGIVSDAFAGYFIENELPEYGFERKPDSHATFISPIVWHGAGVASSTAFESIVFHTGGLFSPAVRPHLVRAYIDRILLPLLAVLSRSSLPVTVLGPMEAFRCNVEMPNIHLAGEVHPRDAARMISSSILISTPGLGAIYDAISASAPVILLPPTNSTQIQHHRLWTQYGLPTLMSSVVANAISDTVLPLPWPHHANALLHLLSSTSEWHVSNGSEVLGRILGTSEIARFRSSACALSAKLWRQLSSLDPVMTIKNSLVALS